MARLKSKWNGDDWLGRCAWCAQAIPPDHEVFGLRARLRPESSEQAEPGTIQPLALPTANKVVPIIFPALDSPAHGEGVDAMFQACSTACARALRQALARELGLDAQEVPPPGGEPDLPEEATVPEDLPHSFPAAPMASMEKMQRQLHRLLAKQEFQSPEQLNAFLESLSSLRPGSLEISAPPESPLEQAQDIIAQAQTESSRKRRVKLAKRALEISPDCADAYLLLAEETTRDPARQRKLYEQALQAAERALGPDIFREGAGSFWGILETRPYMRARASLAQCLWMLGEHDAAINHYHALLDLNPNDNQGNRYVLADWLLAEGRDEELGRLLKRYPDDAAAGWAYNRALHLFRKEGPSAKATKALAKAVKANGFVPAYLLGLRRLPATPPEHLGFGDENEAVDYVPGAIKNWLKTPYALDWLRDNAP